MTAQERWKEDRRIERLIRRLHQPGPILCGERRYFDRPEGDPLTWTSRARKQSSAKPRNLADHPRGWPSRLTVSGAGRQRRAVDLRDGLERNSDRLISVCYAHHQVTGI